MPDTALVTHTICDVCRPVFRQYLKGCVSDPDGKIAATRASSHGTDAGHCCFCGLRAQPLSVARLGENTSLHCWHSRDAARVNRHRENPCETWSEPVTWVNALPEGEPRRAESLHKLDPSSPLLHSELSEVDDDVRRELLAVLCVTPPRDE